MPIIATMPVFISPDLLARRSDPQASDSRGDTALHHACRVAPDQTALLILRSLMAGSPGVAMAAALNQQNEKGER